MDIFSSKGALLLCILLLNPFLTAEIKSVGRGSYTTARPGTLEPLPAKIYRVESLDAAMPSNQWWSSLAWKPFSQPLFAHPLALRCEERGLVLSNPGSAINGAGGHIMGGGIPEGGDLLIGMGKVTFSEANYAGCSDWFVKAEFRSGEAVLQTQFGHGSPFVFCELEGGQALIRCAVKPILWAGDESSATLGVTVRGHHYGIFGASESTWTGLEGQAFQNENGKGYLSVALLPDNKPETLAFFAERAHNHVTDSRVSFRESKGMIEAAYEVTLESKEQGEGGTLMALYPHQWKYSDTTLTDYRYPSVRGSMKVVAGERFGTNVPIQGLLPVLPKEGLPDPERVLGYLQEEAEAIAEEFKDTYWEGKDLGKWATLAGIADLVEASELRNLFLDEIKERLENWFTASPGEEAPLFFYDENWGTLIGSKASYGSDSQLNDHHFHYGYFIRAATEVARFDPEWAEEWAPMIDLLIRDLASSDREDPLFPYTRCFDFYAGHSWASGHADFGDGNNQESSSESLNAWYGILMWAEARGDIALREKALYLFNTERTAVEEYWFDVSETNFPKEYPHVALGMVWGGKGAFSTWFSGDIDHIHGINWLPFTPASIYMGRFPDYVTRNHDRIVEQREGGTDYNTGWGDLVVMFNALSDPAMAAEYITAHPNCNLEGGNTHAFMYHWIHTLDGLGRNDASVTADHPFTNVYLKNGKRTYAVYHFGNEPLEVRFSDGFQLTASAQSLTVETK